MEVRELALVTPATKEYSEKFSFNLARYLKKRIRKYGEAVGPRFFLAKTVKGEVWDPKRVCPSDIYVGHMDDPCWLTGLRLSEILTDVAEEDSYAYPVGQFPFGLLDVTDALFPLYREIGKCAIDPGHSIYWVSDRYTVDGDTRTCRWCGRVERSRVVEESTEKTIWEPVEAQEARA